MKDTQTAQGGEVILFFQEHKCKQDSLLYSELLQLIMTPWLLIFWGTPPGALFN